MDAAHGKTAARPRARSRRWSRSNEQLPPDSEVARKLGNRVISALTANPLFLSAAIPLHIFPPLFNRYAASSGHHFGLHVDNAVRGDRLTGLRIRTDLSVTLFLASPRTMTAASWWSRTTTARTKSSCRPATRALSGDQPALVTPVTRGARVASFFWLQSMVRDDHARSMIFDLDTAIQAWDGSAVTTPKRSN